MPRRRRTWKPQWRRNWLAWKALAARRVTLALRPLRGALFRDLCQVAPDLSALHRVETDGAAYCFSLGDLSADQEALFAAELVLPDLPPGDHSVLSAELQRDEPRRASPSTP